MKQKIIIVTSNDKNLNDVLQEHNTSVENLNEESKKAWDSILSMFDCEGNNSEKIYIESVETIGD